MNKIDPNTIYYVNENGVGLVRRSLERLEKCKFSDERSKYIAILQSIDNLTWFLLNELYEENTSPYGRKE